MILNDSRRSPQNPALLITATTLLHLGDLRVRSSCVLDRVCPGHEALTHQHHQHQHYQHFQRDHHQQHQQHHNPYHDQLGVCRIHCCMLPGVGGAAGQNGNKYLNGRSRGRSRVIFGDFTEGCCRAFCCDMSTVSIVVPFSGYLAGS